MNSEGQLFLSLIADSFVFPWNNCFTFTSNFLFPFPVNAAQNTPVVACYLGSWAVYRPGYGKFDFDDIDPNLCTHVIYAFAGLNETTNQMVSLDPIYDITNGMLTKRLAYSAKYLKTSCNITYLL